jgi:hypothetical protein
MTKTLRDLKERLFDVEYFAEVEYGDEATGYRLTAARLRKSIANREALLRVFEAGRAFNLTPYERQCIRADAEDNAEYGDTPADRSKWAGVAFALMSPTGWSRYLPNG